MPELKSKYVSEQEMFTENQTCLIPILVHGIFKSVSRLLSETAVTPLSLPLVLQSRVISDILLLLLYLISPDLNFLYTNFAWKKNTF